MGPVRGSSRVLCVVGAAVLSGCYSYVPVERPAPGSVVRVKLPVRTIIARPSEAPETESLEGTVLSAADSVVLEVESRREIQRFQELTRVDTVRLARADLAALDLRTFSKPKTLGLTAFVVGATVALALVALGLGGDEQGRGPPDGGGTTGSVVVNPIVSGVLRALGR
jgi:hypothetical protein